MRPVDARPQVSSRAYRLAFRRRRGTVTLWTIIAVPALLAMLCVVVEIANLWKARVELENALEAAALASVKSWGEGPVSPTLTHREVGVAYASANTINGIPVSIDTNYADGADANDNASCDGNLIFGRVRELIDEHGRWEFDAGERPNCAPGTVLFDASEQGGMNHDNSWGISFLNPSNPPGYTDLRISQIVIDLRASGGVGYFDFTGTDPQLSSNVTPYAVRTSGGAAEQPDMAGFANPASQITFSPTSGTPSTLTITFSAAGGDDGFAPCDRFRFGALVEDVSSGSGGDDGDGIGRDGVGVTVTFTDSGGGFIGTSSATFSDTMGTGCSPTGTSDAHCGSLIVNTTANLPDLPCAPGSASGNNGQSWVLLEGAGSLGFYGVRAQASINVSPLCTNFCGLPIAPFRVTADAFALYECGGVNSPRLIRVPDEHYTCQ